MAASDQDVKRLASRPRYVFNSSSSENPFSSHKHPQNPNLQYVYRFTIIIFKMLFNFKSIFLLVLAANAYASPISSAGNPALETRSLEARAQYKDVDCNGKIFKADILKSSISKAREVQGLKDQKKQGYSYPKPYGNDSGKMFPGASGLYEYPLKSPVYSGSKSPLFVIRNTLY